MEYSSIHILYFVNFTFNIKKIEYDVSNQEHKYSVFLYSGFLKPPLNFTPGILSRTLALWRGLCLLGVKVRGGTWEAGKLRFRVCFF